MLPRRHLAIRAVLIYAAPAWLALAGCSAVPTSGPSRDAVFDASTRQVAPYLLVALSDREIERLQRVTPSSLQGRFGDDRGALEQRIGIGDTLVVTIFEAAAGGLFSQPGADVKQTGSHSAVLPPQIVQRDGSITVPYAGRVPVSGRTTHQIEHLVVERLTGKAIEPQVIVSLDRNIASSVSLNGEAVTGARVPLRAGGDRLLDIIAEAGGIRTPANETFLELTRGGRTVRVPFQALLNDPRENIFARPGDTLTVIRYPLTFTAVGATSANAVVPFDAVGISLAEAIGKAAGLTDGRADPEGVFVFRYEPAAVVRGSPGLTARLAALDAVPVVYTLNMRDPRSLFLARGFAVHDKDILYVSNSPYVELTKVVGVINALLAPALGGVSAAQTIAGATNASNLAVLSASSAAAARASTASAASAATP